MVKQDARPRSQESVGTRFTRRTVARGLAWTAPVVAVAAAAPAFATSHCVLSLEIDPTASCKDANSARYKLTFVLVASGCEVPDGCTARITEVRELEGQKTVLFTSEAGVATGDPVVICEARNLAAFLFVTATLSAECGGTTGSQSFTVKTSQFTSAPAECGALDFAGCSNTTTTTTTKRPR